MELPLSELFISEKVIGLSNLSRFSGDAKGKLELKPVDFNPLLSDAASSATRDERTEVNI